MGDVTDEVVRERKEEVFFFSEKKGPKGKKDKGSSRNSVIGQIKRISGEKEREEKGGAR